MKKLLLILTVTCGFFVPVDAADAGAPAGRRASRFSPVVDAPDIAVDQVRLADAVAKATDAAIKARPNIPVDQVRSAAAVAEATNPAIEARPRTTFDRITTRASGLKESALAMAKKTCSGLSRYPLAVPAVAGAAAAVFLPSSRPLLGISAATAGVAFGAYKAMNVASLRTALNAASRFASGLCNFAKNTVKCPTATGFLGLATWSLIRTPGRFVKAYTKIEQEGNYVPAVMVPVVTLATAGIAYLAAKKLWQYRAPAAPAPAPVRVALVNPQHRR